MASLIIHQNINADTFVSDAKAEAEKLISLVERGIFADAELALVA